MAKYNSLHPEKPWVLAHLSDLHLARTAGLRLRDLCGKRFLGWLRWHLKRRFRQDERLLTTLGRDLQQTAPDHIAITGDLCHLSLTAEFAAARAWLERLEDPARCSLVLGNHDQYVATAQEHNWGLFLPWLKGDTPLADAYYPAQLDALFPLVQQRGRMVLISLNTARPSAPHLASGAIGAAQLERLRQIFIKLQGQPLFRIVLLHHPPVQGLLSRRRGLADGAELRALLRQCGAELILRCHSHHRFIASLPGPCDPIPVVGAPSITSIESRPEKRSRYFLITIQADNDLQPDDSGSSGWQIRLKSRLLAPDGQGFIDDPEERMFRVAAPAGRPARTACAGG